MRNTCAATPLRNPIRCAKCGRFARMEDMRWYHSIGVRFLHPECEAKLMTEKQIYETWYGTRIWRRC